MPHRWTQPLPVLLVVTLCLAAGCNLSWSPVSLDAWVVNDMVSLTERTPKVDDPLIFDPVGGAVNLFAAANETVSFQLPVQAGGTALRGLRVSWSDLTGSDGGTIDAENVRVFRMVPIRVREYPAWYLRLAEQQPEPVDFYDALVPVDASRGGQPYRLESHERTAFWVDVYVPRGARPGQYTGRVTVSAWGGRAWSAGVRVRVYNFVLPDTHPIAAFGGFDHRTLMGGLLRRDGKPFVPLHLDRTDPLVRRGLVALRQLMRLGRAHRLDLFDKGIRPLLKRDPEGKVRLDWSDYDAIVTPYLGGTGYEDRIGIAAWASPVSQDWPDPGDYGGTDTEAYQQTLKAVAGAASEHFRALGADKQIFIWCYRGPVRAAAYDKDVQWGRRIRSADPQTPLLSRLPASPPALTGWTPPADFRQFADVLAPPGEWLDPDAAPPDAEPPGPLKGLWVCPGTPPYFPSLGVIAGPCGVRAIAWFAMKYRTRGVFLPEVLNWSGQDLFGLVAGAETRLFYPGTAAGIEGVLPSVRLKRLRRGLQDAAYLRVLRQRGSGEIADAVIEAMARYAGLHAAGDHYLDPLLDGWVTDPAAWEMGRRILAEEIQFAVHPDEVSQRELFAQRVAWRTFNERTHDVRLDRIRSRIFANQAGAAAAGSQRGLRAEVALELWNEHARAVDVVVKTGGLLEGWTPVDGERNVRGMRPGERRVVVLAAAGTEVPSFVDGKLPFPVILRSQFRPEKTIAASVPFLTVGRASKAPRIDGDLVDWPIRAGNAGGRFRLIGRRGRGESGLARRQTQAFVLHDEDHLYIALRCLEPEMSKLVARSDNLVRYQQLIACEEDLVEILLDPGVKASGPEELYHVVVKPSGVFVAERGVGTDPPLGKVRPWACDAKVAVRRSPKDWVVELAIPLSSFGLLGREEFWGVNFTRFAAQGLESSSWSGAARYFYHPRNLGTMRFGFPEGP
ncbi:MAG TPA: hypothetical protein VFJ30_02010 [Phycisphaerae bacterium]|nr:hypothetical protein [Phycisphaerae bacterium]